MRTEHDEIREGFLMEGMHDSIHLGAVHSAYMFDDDGPKRPLQEAQQLTLAMIRELL